MRIVSEFPATLPDQTQLPESDGTFVKNFQEHPQSPLLTDSITLVFNSFTPIITTTSVRIAASTCALLTRQSKEQKPPTGFMFP